MTNIILATLFSFPQLTITVENQGFTPLYINVKHDIVSLCDRMIYYANVIPYYRKKILNQAQKR